MRSAFPAAIFFGLLGLGFAYDMHAGQPAATGDGPALIVLKPARVFDGTTTHDGWVVVVRGKKIEAAGPADKIDVPKGARVIDLPKATLLPGLIDAHTHVLLHPYNEATWDD